MDVCEEQNNKIFTNISNDDFNNSKVKKKINFTLEISLDYKNKPKISFF